MILKDLTSGRMISSDLKICKNFADKLFGLLAKSNPDALYLESRFGIHTLFLKKQIDIVILDINFRVVNLKQSLKPNSVFFWNPKYNKILELPKNTIENFKIKLGNQLAISS
jgi:uncharacterized membrane protein (UPF0127 family)